MSTSVNVCEYTVHDVQTAVVSSRSGSSSICSGGLSSIRNVYKLLRLSHSRSPQQQAAQWTALVYVTVNRFVFSEGKRVQNIRRVQLGHDAGRTAGVVELYEASRREIFTTRAQHDDTVLPHVLPGRLLTAVLACLVAMAIPVSMWVIAVQYNDTNVLCGMGT